ncbi:MAG: DUF4160 domain-containing protein [Cyclobacteriaceae bacterium]|nr:DUF4160 domain-containing protein [Cyclobacteriaceae bacterium]
MPTILNKDGFRFFFFSDEGSEPCHIHVKKAESMGKIWLLPEIKENYYYGFNEQEKRKIRNIVKENYKYLIQKWDEYFK